MKIPNGIISNESPLQGPALEELPAEGDSEQWTVPRVPADADGWPHFSLLPGDAPNAEMVQEAPDQDHIARISCLDLTLYENWESLSSKREAKRAKEAILTNSVGLKLVRKIWLIRFILGCALVA